MKKLLIIIVILGVIIMSLANTPWPIYRRDIRNTGYTPHNVLAEPTSVKKLAPGGGRISIGDNIIYANNENGRLMAMDLNGNIQWVYEDVAVRQSPTIGDDGTIYIMTYSPYDLRAISPKGTLKWIYDIPGYAEYSPTIASDGTIYIGDDYDDPYIYAVNPNGTQKWRKNLGTSAFYGTWPIPAIGADGTIYISVAGTNRLYALYPDTGYNKWYRTLAEQPASGIIIGDDGTIYAETVKLPNSFIYAYNPDGTRKWKYSYLQLSYKPLAFGNNTIYFPSKNETGEKVLRAITSDGSFKWEYRIDDIYGFQDGPIVTSDGTIYVSLSNSDTLENDCIVAINPDGTRKWKYIGTPNTGNPVINKDGLIYLSVDGYISVLRSGELYFKGFTTKIVENIQHFPGGKIRKEFD